VLVFSSTAGDHLLFFPYFLEVTAQFVPHSAVQGAALAGLESALSALPAHSRAAVPGLKAVIDRRIPMTALEDGSISPGSETTLSLGFEGGYRLDVGNTAVSWMKDLSEAGISIRWRDRAP
jgi:hypothetical protein